MLCQCHLSSVSHSCGEGSPGDRTQPTSSQPLLQDGQVGKVGVSKVLGLDGSHSGSSAVLEEEGPQHGIADAQLLGDVEMCAFGWEADEERQTGPVLCAGREGIREVKE